MATFGEIFEPTSRTLWEDWDEGSDNLEQFNLETIDSELKWINNSPTPSSIDTLLILEGKYLSDCIKAQKSCNLDLIDFIPNVNLNLYKSVDLNKYICSVRDYSLLMSSEIVELLKAYITKSSQVITVQTKPLVEYQTSAAVSQDCIIRSITTTGTSENSSLKFPKLEQPNMISGLSAGVISLREHLKQNGTAIVCYMGYTEDYDVQDVQKLLQKLDIVQNQKLLSSSVLNSNLYI